MNNSLQGARRPVVGPPEPLHAKGAPPIVVLGRPGTTRRHRLCGERGSRGGKASIRCAFVTVGGERHTAFALLQLVRRRCRDQVFREPDVGADERHALLTTRCDRPRTIAAYTAEPNRPAVLRIGRRRSAELRTWLARELPSLPVAPATTAARLAGATTPIGSGRLHDAGYAGISWPKAFGGRARRRRANSSCSSKRPRCIPRCRCELRGNVACGGPTLIAEGDDAQKTAYLGRRSSVVTRVVPVLLGAECGL